MNSTILPQFLKSSEFGEKYGKLFKDIEIIKFPTLHKSPNMYKNEFNKANNIDMYFLIFKHLLKEN